MDPVTEIELFGRMKKKRIRICCPEKNAITYGLCRFIAKLIGPLKDKTEKQQMVLLFNGHNCVARANI